MNERPAVHNANTELPPGVQRARGYRYSSPVFVLTADIPALMPGPRPAIADVELDIAGRPVVELRQMIHEGLLGSPSAEFGLPFHVRFDIGLRNFGVLVFDHQYDLCERYELDPWERAERAQVDLDVAGDELSELDIDRPASVMQGLDLTLRMLSGWFEVEPLPGDDVAGWDDGWLGNEIAARGTWTVGPPPWRM